MQCQICKDREATIHLTEITDGVRAEKHICERCATEQGLAVKSHIPLNELLGGLLASVPESEDFFGLSDKETSCEYCGFTLEQFRKEAVLGCPHDYEVFEKSLLPLIAKAHDGRTTHCGKVPSRAPEDAKRQAELLSLRQQLEAAVKAEDYESAARLRDKISELE
jgi:protein arginine kinase activator